MCVLSTVKEKGNDNAKVKIQRHRSLSPLRPKSQGESHFILALMPEVDPHALSNDNSLWFDTCQPITLLAKPF